VETCWGAILAVTVVVSKGYGMAKQLKRIVELDDGFAVDVAGLTMVVKRRGDGWTIIIDDAAELTYRCDENDMCHIAIEKAA
jgi:hypothetical protein